MGGSPALCRVRRVAPTIRHRAGAAQRGPADAAADDRRESAEELVAVAPRRAARVTQPPQRCSGRGNPIACGKPEHARLHRRRRAMDGIGATPRRRATTECNACTISVPTVSMMHCTALHAQARPGPHHHEHTHCGTGRAHAIQRTAVLQRTPGVRPRRGTPAHYQWKPGVRVCVSVCVCVCCRSSVRVRVRACV